MVVRWGGLGSDSSWQGPATSSPLSRVLACMPQFVPCTFVAMNDKPWKSFCAALLLMSCGGDSDDSFPADAATSSADASAAQPDAAVSAPASFRFTARLDGVESMLSGVDGEAGATVACLYEQGQDLFRLGITVDGHEIEADVTMRADGSCSGRVIEEPSSLTYFNDGSLYEESTDAITFFTCLQSYNFVDGGPGLNFNFSGGPLFVGGNSGQQEARIIDGNVKCSVTSF